MTDPDPFAWVRGATVLHQQQHGCTAFTYRDDLLPGVLAAAVAPRRAVEVGTALGYLTLWLATATPLTLVDTIELDLLHVELARRNFATAGVAERITSHAGPAQTVLEDLPGGYDIAVFDGFRPDPAILGQLEARLRPGGLLLMANMSHPGTDPVRAALADPSRWIGDVRGDLAVAVRR